MFSKPGPSGICSVSSDSVDIIIPGSSTDIDAGGVVKIIVCPRCPSGTLDLWIEADDLGAEFDMEADIVSPDPVDRGSVFGSSSSTDLFSFSFPTDNPLTFS